LGPVSVVFLVEHTSRSGRVKEERSSRGCFWEEVLDFLSEMELEMKGGVLPCYRRLPRVFWGVFKEYMAGWPAVRTSPGHFFRRAHQLLPSSRGFSDIRNRSFWLI